MVKEKEYKIFGGRIKMKMEKREIGSLIKKNLISLLKGKKNNILSLSKGHNKK
jgi:hypothetical protein